MTMRAPFTVAIGLMAGCVLGRAGAGGGGSDDDITCRGGDHRS